MIGKALNVPPEKMEQRSRNGYNGRILHVDLTDGGLSVEEPGEAFYQTYVGGRAIVCYYLLRELPKGADPLGPENLLIFAPGVITGTSLPGSGRHGVGGKSPLTGALGSAEAGGWWGTEFKRAGFDALIVSGRAETPVYLWINDGRVEIRDASKLWGRLTADVETAIRSELGDDRIRVAQIGPAGERLVRYACIINNANRAAGRTGLGAVMGSKNLKAVAVRGTATLGVADEARVKRVGKWLANNYRERPLASFFVEAGTGSSVISLNEGGSLPTRNFQDPEFPEAEAIDNTTWLDKMIVARDTCPVCPVYCKVATELSEGEGEYVINRAYGGPEYETLGAFGSDCGVDDFAAIAKANEICNAHGIDTISAGTTIAFVMECFEKGILTQEDTGGLNLRFGNAAAMVRAVEMIVRREGFGDKLAEGSARLANEIGNGAEQYAIHVKGLELPMHEPRAKFALGVGYEVSPTGADHNHNFHDTSFESHGNGIEHLSVFGITEPMDPYVLNSQKMKAFYYHTNFMHALDCAGVCHFQPYHYTHIADALAGVSGWDVGVEEVLHLGERTATLARLFNLREGFTAADDKLPKRFFKAFKDGPLAGITLTPEAVERARHMYYELMGWDPEEGVPQRERLEALGLEEFVGFSSSQ